jgi:hypothetical protein
MWGDIGGFERSSIIAGNAPQGARSGFAPVSAGSPGPSVTAAGMTKTVYDWIVWEAGEAMRNVDSNNRPIPFHLAFHHEANYNTNPRCDKGLAGTGTDPCYYGTPQEWNWAIHTIADIFTFAGATNVTWGIILGQIGFVDGSIAKFWPANDCWTNTNLAWAGMDGYNRYCGSAPDAGYCAGLNCDCHGMYEDIETLFQPLKTWYDGQVQIAGSRLEPWITELGSPDMIGNTASGYAQTDKALWLVKGRDWIKGQFPQLKGISYWVGAGCSIKPLSRCDFRFHPSGDTEQVAAWNEWVAYGQDPAFQAAYQPNPASSPHCEQ